MNQYLEKRLVCLNLVFFSKHVEKGAQKTLVSILGMAILEGKGKYLVLPYIIGQNKEGLPFSKSSARPPSG